MIRDYLQNMTNSNLKSFASKPLQNILVRSTNWIGDVVMTLPAIAAVRTSFPEAKISVLAKPWVADIYRICPDIDEVIIYERPGVHDGITGIFRLAGKLRDKKFDAAILLQNAVEAAIIVWLAGIPIRAGYNSDGRGILLTHSVRRTKAIRKVHQTGYYLAMLRSLGLRAEQKPVSLRPGEEYTKLSDELSTKFGFGAHPLLVGMAPGAAYGPAKRWYPERFAAVADRLIDEFSAVVILFGSEGDRPSADLVQKNAKGKLINIAGRTSVREVIALIMRCGLFISNDSGLMHLAGALGVPTVAIFGSTSPAATAPPGEKSVIITKNADCSPCLKTNCPTDFRCMDLITVDDVYNISKELLDSK